MVIDLVFFLDPLLPLLVVMNILDRMVPRMGVRGRADTHPSNKRM